MIFSVDLTEMPDDATRLDRRSYLTQWYLKVVKDNFANFQGRARRQEYWMFILFNSLFAFAALLLDGLLGLGFLYALYALAMFIPSTAVAVRRLHDTGKSGWWLLIVLVPIIGSIWFLVLLCTDSENGANSFGPSPKATA